MPKTEVREYASAMGLRTAAKPDSQDLCFVGEGSYRDFIRERFPEAARPGPLVMSDGTVLAQHEGMVDFTIGQRKGLGVALGERRYVVDIDPATATVTLGTKQELLAAGCVIDQVSFVAGSPPTSAEVDVKIRYRSVAVPARIEPIGDGSWRILFGDPQSAVAPGQSAVLHHADEVLGGGVISEAVR
jgi:tRNA-specific 2-thiouridylase